MQIINKIKGIKKLSALVIDTAKDWGGYRLVNLGAPTTAGDALRKGHAEITNAEIAAAAAIAYAKLALTGKIKAADIEDAASIPLSKLVDAVCSKTEADGKITTHKADADAHPRLVTIARKTANQTVTNSTTLVNVTDLVHAILANEVWYYEFVLKILSQSDADIDLTIVVPSGASGYWWTDDILSVLTAGLAFTGIAFATKKRKDGTGATQLTHLYALVICGATPGNVQLQFAQHTAQANDATIYENSHLRAHRSL